MNANSWRRKLKTIFNTWVSYPERVYLVIALVGVIGFALITPPFHGPDEESHYLRAQYIAHGYLLPVDVHKAGASLPRSIMDVAMDTFYSGDIRGNTAAKYDISHIKNALGQPFDNGKTYQPAMISYSPIPYLSAIPAIVVSNTLNLSPLVSMYLARLSLGIFCVAVTFFSIKLIPNKKYFVVGIALIPMLLFQQAVVSADGVSYALLLAFVSLVAYLHQKKTSIKNKEWILVGVLCIVITLAKPLVFLFLPLIAILIKREKAFRWITGITVICVILLGSLTLYNSRLSEMSVDPNVPKQADSSAQLNNLKEHPKRFLRVMWNSYMTPYGDDEVRGVIGIFGASDTMYPLWMTIGYTTILALLASVNFDKSRSRLSIQGWVKWLLIGLSILYFLLVNIAIYISFSPYNFDIVYGVQGRYFIPILIMLPVFITPFLLPRAKGDTRLLRYLCLGMMLFVCLALFITTQRYYLYTP